MAAGGILATGRETRRSNLGVALTLSGGLALGLLWALAVAWLIGLPDGMIARARPELFACGLGVGLLSTALLPQGELGALGAFRLGLRFATAGLVGAGLSALAAARTLGRPLAAALGLGALGLALGLALVLLALALHFERTADHSRTAGRGAGVPLRRLVATLSGALALSAWALASGHLYGQLAAGAHEQALSQARDLVAIGVARQDDADLPALLAALAPPAGALVTIDQQDRVTSGEGTAIGAAIALSPDATRCTFGGRRLPCAVRGIGNGTRLVAAIAPVPLDSSRVLLFLCAGLGVTLAALAIGGLGGASVARDLERVAESIDDLRRSAKSLQLGLDLEQPIVVGSLDEAGDLAAALGRLRAHLSPVISEYRSALERAQAADQARDEFLSLVSVELRSPLNQIIASAQSLLDLRSEPLSSEQRDDVKTVLSASRHLTDLIDEVLDVSAIATGQVSLRLAQVDLGKLTADVARAQRPIVQKKGVEVKLTCDEPSPRVSGDERRLRQVLTNIISNAVKFTERGAIEISVVHKGARVCVTVHDTGPGIAPESLGKLFREFVQLGSLKQRAHGTGLGLAICKRLVDAHDGEVWAESTLGEGSTFHVAVPVAGPAPRVAVTDDTPVQGAPELDG